MTDHDEAVQIGYAVLRDYDKATAHDVSVVKNVVAALARAGLLARPGELAALRAVAAVVHEFTEKYIGDDVPRGLVPVQYDDIAALDAAPAAETAAGEV